MDEKPKKVGLTRLGFQIGMGFWWAWLTMTFADSLARVLWHYIKIKFFASTGIPI